MLQYATAILDSWVVHRIFSVWRVITKAMRRARTAVDRRVLVKRFGTWRQFVGRDSKLRDLGARSQARCSRDVCLRCLGRLYEHATWHRLHRFKCGVITRRVGA